MTNTKIIDCTTCKYGYEDEQLGIPMCHHPKRFSEDCVDFNMHEEKPVPNDLKEYASRAGFDYVDNIVQEHPGHRFNDHDVEFAYRDGIIAGAKWDRNQMMQEAVEGEVCIPNVWVEKKEGKELVVRAEISKELGFKFGDKVLVSILKKEE